MAMCTCASSRRGVRVGVAVWGSRCPRCYQGNSIWRPRREWCIWFLGSQASWAGPPPQSGSQSPFAPLTWRVVVPSTAFWATKRPPDLQLSGPLNHPMVASRVRPEHPELCPSAILVVSAQLWPKNLFSYGSHLGKVLELPGRTKALESEAQLLTGALGIRMSPPWDSLARQWPFHPDESILSLLTSVL